MTTAELTALLDRISQGTTTHEDAVRLARYVVNVPLDDNHDRRLVQQRRAEAWLNANQDAA